MSAKQSEVPKITQTSPPEQREGHEKYSLPASATIRTSCEAIRGGGGLSAMKMSFRWLMIRIGIQEMNQKPEGDTEDQIPPGKDNRITNLLLHSVHKS
jgi:hypothetical protein